ncbi:hypothetical protein BGY98DRAFT_1174383 [Russula aff. rugulosa BPL654]|nr:hypothetical protein BGY98DRAFT_1174383 [Russula aff. rugulosa BPL654]
MMNSNPRKTHSFKYPSNRLLMLKGAILDEEMRHCHLIALDQNNEPRLMVIKRSRTTGLTTIGWAIFSSRFNSKSGALRHNSRRGFGLGFCHRRRPLHWRCWHHAFPDITYATPVSFLLKCMHDRGLSLPDIDPVLTAERIWQIDTHRSGLYLTFATK